MIAAVCADPDQSVLRAISALSPRCLRALYQMSTRCPRRVHELCRPTSCIRAVYELYVSCIRAVYELCTSCLRAVYELSTTYLVLRGRLAQIAPQDFALWDVGYLRRRQITPQDFGALGGRSATSPMNRSTRFRAPPEFDQVLHTAMRLKWCQVY